MPTPSDVEFNTKGFSMRDWLSSIPEAHGYEDLESLHTGLGNCSASSPRKHSITRDCVKRSDLSGCMSACSSEL